MRVLKDYGPPRELRLADLRRRYQLGLYNAQIREISARIVDDHLSL